MSARSGLPEDQRYALLYELWSLYRGCCCKEAALTPWTNSGRLGCKQERWGDGRRVMGLQAVCLRGSVRLARSWTAGVSEMSFRPEPGMAQLGGRALMREREEAAPRRQRHFLFCASHRSCAAGFAEVGRMLLSAWIRAQQEQVGGRERGSEACTTCCIMLILPGAVRFSRDCQASRHRVRLVLIYLKPMTLSVGRDTIAGGKRSASSISLLHRAAEAAECKPCSFRRGLAVSGWDGSGIERLFGMLYA